MLKGPYQGFETEAELAEFLAISRKIAIAKEVHKEKRRTAKVRAKLLWMAFLEDPEIEINWDSLMDDAIRKYLDHTSITEFVILVAKDHQTIVAKAKALKRHAENHAMKSEVFQWLDANRGKFKSMDAAAEAITKQQPIAFRTARAWTGDWKKLRSTGTL